VIVREDGGAQVVDLKRRTSDELTTPSRAMSSVVAVGEVDGRAVAATGGRDGTVQIWDLATRQPVGIPMAGHQRRVVSVALGEADGHSVAVTGALDGTMRIWDLAARRSVEMRLGSRLARVSTSPIVRLAARHDNAGEGGDWDSRVARARNRLTENSAGSAVRSLTISSLFASPAALLGDDDGNVSVVDLAAGKPCLEVQCVTHAAGSLSLDGMTTGTEATPGPDRPGAAPDAAPWQVTAITCDQIAGHAVALVTIGGRTSMILDLRTGQWVKTGTISDRLIVGRPKPLSDLILISGSLVRVADGEDGTVTVQDDTTTQSLPGKHDGPVTAVACQHLADQPLAFTGGQDGKVRVWDLAARQLLDVIDVTGPVFAIEATRDGDLLVGAAGEAIAFQHANFLPSRSGPPRRRATGRKPRPRPADVARGGTG